MPSAIHFDGQDVHSYIALVLRPCVVVSRRHAHVGRDLLEVLEPHGVAVRPHDAEAQVQDGLQVDWPRAGQLGEGLCAVLKQARAAAEGFPREFCGDDCMTRVPVQQGIAYGQQGLHCMSLRMCGHAKNSV